MESAHSPKAPMRNNVKKDNTMKKLMTIMAAGLLALTANAQEAYTITGTAEGTVKGDKIYLCQMQGFFAMVPEDSALVDKKGNFELKGTVDGCTNRWLVALHNGENLGMCDVLLEAGPIKVQMFKDSKRNVVEGGECQKLYKEYEAGARQYDDQIAKDWAVCLDTTIAEKDKIKERLVVETYSRQREEWEKRFMLEHAGTPVGDMLLAYHLQSFKNDDQEKVLAYFGQQPRQFHVYKSLIAQQNAEKATAEGAQYTDFSMPDTNGKTVSVSDFVGKSKYVLIDFWASWCGPCRAEMPAVLKAYNEFHTKGFEVVGVSLDNSKEAWLKGIEQLKLPWPQMSDIKGWECEGAKLYNVRAIPANVLVDINGKIIAKNLRGEDLYNKMAELLK